MLKSEVLFLRRFLPVEITGVAQCVSKRGAGLVESQYLSVDSAKRRDVVFNQPPLGFQAPLWPRSVGSVLVVVICNTPPKNPCSLLVSNDSGHKEYRSAQLLLLCSVEVFPLHAWLCWASFVRHSRTSLFPPPRHDKVAQVKDKYSTARTEDCEVQAVCSEQTRPFNLPRGAR